MKHIIYSTLISIFLLSSCTSPIDIIVDDAPPKLVIYAVFNQTMDYKQVKVSTTAPFFGDKTPKVSNAKVKVTSSQGQTYTFEEDIAELGTYISETAFGVIQGVTYTLTVKVDFTNDGIDEIYEAKSEVPLAFPIDSVTIIKNIMFGNTIYSTSLYAKNPEGDDYFLAKISVNDVLATKKISDYGIFQDQLIPDSDFNGTIIYMLMDEKHRDDFDDLQQQDLIFVKSGDKITMTLSKIEESYFHFLDECMREYEGENPIFGGPPSNIRTNISGGAIGFFTTYYTQEKNSYVE